MNDINEFANHVKDSILDYLPGEYAGAKVNLSTTTKVNKNATAISVYPNWANDSLIPTINLNQSYKAYQNGQPIEDLMENIASVIKEAFQSVRGKTPNIDIANIPEDKVFFQLINTDSNKDLLSTCPHREFHDMSLIYRMLYNKSDDGIESVRITDDLMNTWGVDEEKLFELASENTKEIFKPRIQTMGEVMMGFLGMDESMDPEMLDELLESSPLWLVSNDMCVNGATMMVYDDVLSDVAGRIGDDLYILPSSLHEFLAVPMSEIDPDDLSHMVQDVNQEHVNEEDRLSNQVFSYDRKAHELNVAVVNPIKGILNSDFSASKVAEPIPFTAHPDSPSMNAR